MPAPVRPGFRLPLLVTADADLLDELLRIAAAAGTEVDVAPDPTAARPRWSRAPLVIVGQDQAAACLRARLPRRQRVVIVGRGPAPGWDLAEPLGAEYVLQLPEAEEWLLRRLGPSVDAGGRVVAVLGGRGGAGASVLAGALAVTAARDGKRTLLIDADPFGGGLDLILGWETVEGLRWPGLTAAEGRFDPLALVRALPQRGDLVMLSFDRGDPLPLPAEALAAALDAGRRARDLIVVDLPRRLDDAAVAALQAADHTLLVVPAELRATAAATQVAKAVTMHCAAASVVVRGPAPGNLSATEVARSVGFPLAGLLPSEPGLVRGLEHGEAPASGGRGPLADLCRRVITDLFGNGGVAAA
ncbi:secretion/DNA translocation related CpaE-like protein [Asanoa ferruginea]|uniref:Secretion/DNA translocation related CpaE-like protein n=1 Tax=Asanoa ferruginea TaxID=53367 RepID=A0A3D9ZEK5_9ACTN|nr:septum site-determining protein Ssd [Asanoa ferruginea]REF95731.1 secretion/DNA translocation related CpaE-like protein [Asanoa ferruginea]GIF53293.1 septum formation initiator [Asanoa ferruginea]